MKNVITATLFIIVSLLFGGNQVKMSSVLSPDLWGKGFSATVKTTSNFPGQMAVEPYTLYTEDDNSRMDTKSNISIYRSEGGVTTVYSYDKNAKTYSVFTFDDNSDDEEEQEGMEKPVDFDQEELIEKVGSETFAGIKCDKYRMIANDDEEGSEGYEQFMFIDPAKKIFVGTEMKTGGFFMRTEFTNLKFKVDKSMFKPLSGYKKVN